MNHTFTLSKPEATALVQPYAQMFYDALIGGFKDFMDVQIQVKPITNRSVKANVIWDYTIQRINKLIMDHPESLRLIVKRKMVLVIIKDQVALRVKKYNNNFLPSNIKTAQVVEFRNRTLTLDNNKKVFPIDVAWQVNEYYTEIIDVHFVCPDGEKSNLWSIKLQNVEKAEVKPELFESEVGDFLPVLNLKPELDRHEKTAS